MVAEQETDTSVSGSNSKSIDLKSPLESINSGMLSRSHVFRTRMDFSGGVQSKSAQGQPLGQFVYIR